ncbi:MAG: hypothetical protein K2X87_34125 [Gemmataceae bacterium]|nr:hypothetical protein [Gemmataceae bacterium]
MLVLSGRFRRSIESLSFGPGGRELAAAIPEHTAVWDTLTGELVRTWKPVPRLLPDALDFDPAGGWLYLCLRWPGFAAADGPALHDSHALGLGGQPGEPAAVAVRPGGAGFVVAYNWPARLFWFDHPARRPSAGNDRSTGPTRAAPTSGAWRSSPTAPGSRPPSST